MSQERDKIEHMVQQGRLTRAEADELLAALEPEDAGQTHQPLQEPQPRTRRTFRIHVDEARSGERVDLGFPITLAGIGLNILARKGSATIDVDGEKVPVDVNELKHLIADPSFVGELMHVHTGDGDDVTISVE